MTTPTIDVPFIEQYIYNSNLIEGVTDPREIDQSLEAWFCLTGEDVLTKEVVLWLHKKIMENLLPDRIGGKGSLRIINVEVGGRACPHWNRVSELLDAWLVDMANLNDMDPKTAHIDFEHIHPFIDGNGRVGRMLMWWHEVKLGKTPTLITYDERWNYYEWF